MSKAWLGLEEIHGWSDELTRWSTVGPRPRGWTAVEEWAESSSTGSSYWSQTATGGHPVPRRTPDMVTGKLGGVVPRAELMREAGRGLSEARSPALSIRASSCNFRSDLGENRASLASPSLPQS